MDYVNQNNFCRWISDLSDAECYYAMPLYEGDDISIFANFELDDYLVPFSGLKLGLWNEDLGIYLEDIATLNQIVISGDIYSVYADTWVVPELAPLNYRFVLYNGSANIFYYSNTFSKINITGHTAIIKYNHVVNTLGYLYEDAPTFYNQYRIDLRIGSPTYNENVKGYETYEGDVINVKSDIQKLVKFSTRFFDEGTHEAFFSMLAHSEILIDGVEYKKSQDSSYEISWPDSDYNKIANGEVNLLKVDYSAAVKSC